jgi:hypothetical protein
MQSGDQAFEAVTAFAEKTQGFRKSAACDHKGNTRRRGTGGTGRKVGDGGAGSYIGRNISKGTDGRGIVAGFADGSAWLLDETVPLQELKRFFTAAHVIRDRDAILGSYRLLSTSKALGLEGPVMFAKVQIKGVREFKGLRPRHVSV